MGEGGGEVREGLWRTDWWRCGGEEVRRGGGGRVVTWELCASYRNKD